MITAISLENFKSIKETTLRLGSFNLFIGTNASGKSNFFDSLRFLQGVGWRMRVDEILNGRPRTGTGSEWSGVRGGGEFLAWKPSPLETRREPALVCVNVSVGSMSNPEESVNYHIGIDTKKVCVLSESLVENGKKTILDTSAIKSHPDDGPVIKAAYKEKEGNHGRRPHLEFDKGIPILQQAATHAKISLADRRLAENLLKSLRDMQRIDPSPNILRQYGSALDVERMGEHGENFAALVKRICADPVRKESYLDWLRELRPAELDDIAVLAGALGEPMFALVEKGRVFPAPVLSDGTLRFAAIAAAFFQPSMPEVLMLEEIENGVHAGRLRLLLELMKSRAGATGTQVLATTHSALLLDWLEPEDYRHVFLCARDPESGATQITPLSEVPHFLEAVKETPASQLVTEGWMEMAL